MEREEIAGLRLINQKISGSRTDKPEEVVSSLGAMQAQAYQDALWGIGLRCRHAAKRDVEEAISEKRIIRTWAMRGTWHFVPPTEVRWMLSLYPEENRIPSYQRKHGLTEPILRKGLSVISRAFNYKEILSYKELGMALADSGVSELRNIDVQRHIIRRAGRKGIICFASHICGKPAFMLLEKSVPSQSALSRDLILARLAKVYFESHGPATLDDFSWWAGIKKTDAKTGVDFVAAELRTEVIDENTYWMPKGLPRRKSAGAQMDAYLLPAFDEYLIAYKDRRAIIEEKNLKKVINGSTLQFLPIIVIGGRVVGTWKRTTRPDKEEIILKPFNKLSSAQGEALSAAAARYASFIGKKTVLSK